MERSPVPKFGHWESEESVPYTAYFDKARKARTPVVITPNANASSNAEAGVSEESSSNVHPQARPDEPKQEEPLPNVTNNRREGGRNTPENNRYEKSPMHDHARASTRSVTVPSPLRDGNKNSYDGIGRSKPRSNVKADGSPDKGTVVPKFGDWDDNSSSTADGYTHIFNRVREERKYAGAGPDPVRTTSQPSNKPPSDGSMTS